MPTVRGMLAACLAVAASPSILRPQRLRGEVVLADSISRAAGVIVTASDMSGTVVARTTRRERGEFDLPLPRGGRYRVRSLRLGFRPTDVTPMDVADDQVRCCALYWPAR
jgi:hypothetical protein